MNILIVDDEYLELEQMEYLIRRKYPHFQCFCGEDAVTAMRVLDSHAIQLAFVDILLPNEDGLKLSERMVERQPDMDIVIVSAHQDFNYAKKAIQLEVLDYLVKPFLESELYDTIEKWLSKHHYKVGRSPHVQHVLKRIQESYSQKLSLNDIAKEIPINPSYLSHCFSDEIGETFQEYLLSYRINQSKKLLEQHPDWSMTVIAERAGFSSQNHFSNAFKKITGVTPSKFKGQGQ
ncbi:helix-turn-helix domain-containing protein [Paenibacillus glycanilyticus]|uniref:response regulator transcription factor n=1 Tax=Paenibacillus glycanilyticus TaxID=126569 RepID=UPI00203E0110|nr:helix-turn-helix domain-containing protein [Paenibacillus glycanilyticus]MCM3629868.1 helix-turn-helix domain-containing protein [Paenibacillus glycanilyticus]